VRDAALTEILAGIYEPGPDGRRPPECLYGSLKMWDYLRCQGIRVARCTVERLMRANGWRGVTRAGTTRTTTPDPARTRAPDLVNRNFTAQRPGQLHVADFTYVPLDGGGFGYTAFVIDAFAGLIAGWECSLSKETAFVERAIRQAAALRARQGHPISGRAVHHSKITQIQARAPGPVTSSQQSHLAKLRHTKPGVHETRDAPAAVVGPPAKATDHESSPPSISRLSEAAPPAGATAARPESGAAAAKPHHRRSARNRRSARRRARNGVTALVAASAQVPPT